MSSSKIKLKVQHKKHQKQVKEKVNQSIQTIKQQKSGTKLGKSKSKQKDVKKVISQQSEQQQASKLNKSKSKDKKKYNKQEKQKSPTKKDKKNDKKQDKIDKKDKKDKKQDKKDKKTKDKNEKQGKKDKKGNKKGNKNKNGSDDQDENEKGKRGKQRKKQDKQLQTINNINKHNDKAKLTIGQLIQLYKDVSYDIFINHGHNPQKQRQIEQQLQRLQKQKQKRKQKIQQLNREAQQRRKKKQQGLQQKMRVKKQKILQKRRRSISVRLQSLSEHAKNRQQEYLKFKQYCTQRKRNHVPRYKKYQQQFRQFEQSLEEQRQGILQQRKLKVQPIDYEQLAKFEQQYQQQKIQAFEHGGRKLRLQRKIVNQQNEWMKGLYKGSIRKVVQQQINKNTLKEDYQTAKEKLLRTKEYGKLIKSQFIQHKDEHNDQEKTQDMTYDSEDIRFHEKFVQGKCIGLIPEKKTKPLTNQQKQKLGVQYLQYIRKLPRKGINSSSVSTTIQTPQRIGKTYIQKRLTNPFYNLQRNVTSFDTKNHMQIQLAIEQIKSKDFSTALEQKALSHLQYSDVTDLQKKHSNINRRLIGDINSKLDILKKLVD